MPWRAKCLFFLLHLVIHAGCTTAKSSSLLNTASSESPELAAARRAALFANECPTAEDQCPGEHNPTLCMARSYDGQPLAEAERLIRWGTNPCLARAELSAAACQATWPPSLLGLIECVPDATDGGCPPAPVVCSAEYAPTSCHAEGYDGQKISLEALPAALATNPCRAQFELLVAACRRNLNPRLLERINCQNTEQTGGAPVKQSG